MGDAPRFGDFLPVLGNESIGGGDEVRQTGDSGGIADGDYAPHLF